MMQKSCQSTKPLIRSRFESKRQAECKNLRHFAVISAEEGVKYSDILSLRDWKYDRPDISGLSRSRSRGRPRDGAWHAIVPDGIAKPSVVLRYVRAPCAEVARGRRFVVIRRETIVL